MTRLEEIEEKLKQIRWDNEGWKKCQDGSYEMALDAAGYNVLLKEKEKLSNPDSNKPFGLPIEHFEDRN